MHRRRVRLALGAAAAVLGLAVTVGTPSPAAAQGAGTVRGTVIDSTSRRPIAGAQVMIAGTTRGALTGDDGIYSIANVPAGQQTVRVRRLGYEPVDRRVVVPAGGVVDADFSIMQVATTLAEQVVVGYGTRQRAEVSTAISSVDAEQIANVPTASVDNALQGKAAGVQVVQNAGNPGNGVTVRVRGSASLSASNQPLFVVDGVPVQTGDFSQLALGGQDLTGVTGLNPAEIESIDILKDAAAASIYGSRGSNGVVLITTKRGKAGRARINFNGYTGWQQVDRKVDVLTGRQYMELFNEAIRNDSLLFANESWFDPEEFAPLFSQDEIANAVNTDWQDEVFRTAPVTEMTLSVSGGSDRLQYFLSGTLFDQEGIALSSGYKRQSGRVNVDYQATDKFMIRSSIGLTRDATDRFHNDDSITGVVTNAIANQPNIPVRREDGDFTDVSDGLEYVNPVALAAYNSAETRSLRAVGNVEGAYSFTPELQLTGRVGMDVLNVRDLRWLSPRVGGLYSASVNGVAQMGNNTLNRYIAEAFVNFNPVLGSTGAKIETTTGASVEYNDQEWDYLEGEGFPSDRLRYPGSAGSITSYDAGGTGHNLASFFTRANATFADRYVVTASLRADGSSRFGENNRFGIFPAGSVAWLISNEPFAEGLANWGEFKLRASYGRTGNHQIGNNFASVSRFGKANYGDDAGIAKSGFENPDLKWETTTELDIGAEAFLFNSRLGITVDWYTKQTEDLLFSRPIPSPSGLTSVWTNVGGIRNRGWEFGLNTVNIEPRDNAGFRWTTNLNVAMNKNVVTELYNNEPFTSGFINRIEVGRPMGEFYTLRYLGVDPETGDAIYDDINGDGDINSGDFTFVGSPHPDYFGGLANEFSWRGFSLRGLLQFAQGFQIYNAMRIYSDDGMYFFDNKFANVLNRWQKPGDVTDVPRLSYYGESGAVEESSRFIEDGSYWRLQEITLGYTLPERLLGFGRMQDARVFVTGRNLYTWTDYSGYSPDANSGGSNSNTFLATDFYAYPLARTFTVGVSTTW